MMYLRAKGFEVYTCVIMITFVFGSLFTRDYNFSLAQCISLVMLECFKASRSNFWNCILNYEDYGVWGTEKLELLYL